MPTTEENLAALLQDLQELATYLHGRGDKSLALSKQFEENAKQDSSNREYDLRQATMLDYQHHTWHEIGNMVEKFITQHEKQRLFTRSYLRIEVIATLPPTRFRRRIPLAQIISGAGMNFPPLPPSVIGTA